MSHVLLFGFHFFSFPVLQTPGQVLGSVFTVVHFTSRQAKSYFHSWISALFKKCVKLSKEVTDSTLKNLLRVVDALVFNTTTLSLSLSQDLLILIM